MSSRTTRLTDAYIVGLELRKQLRDGTPLCSALGSLNGPFDMLNDGYPNWHPAPYSFRPMLRLFLYREITGHSYRALTRYPELAEIFGLDRIPDESVLSRTWRKRFDAGVREFLTTAAHFLVKEIHDRDLTVPQAQPKEEVLDSNTVESPFTSETPGSDGEFTDD